MKLRYKNPCPECFGETGHSVVMEAQPLGIYQCPKNPEHRFVRDEQGFWKKLSR